MRYIKEATSFNYISLYKFSHIIHYRYEYFELLKIYRLNHYKIILLLNFNKVSK